MKPRVIPPGARCLTPTKTCVKFSKGTNWLWKRVKTDPDFPQPFYLDGRPLFIEGELDAYLQRKANEAVNPRGPTLTEKRVVKRALRTQAA
jgi:predicted DNA-binding transcriptional regulator AlpA